jgi:hypothetical protein
MIVVSERRKVARIVLARKRVTEDFGVNMKSVPMLRVKTAPNKGQYAFDGRYRFSKYDCGKMVRISYVSREGLHHGQRIDTTST